MNLATIQAKKQEKADKFQELKTQKIQIEEELLRLQGEWRGLDAMENELQEPAKTIEAIEDKKVKK